MFLGFTGDLFLGASPPDDIFSAVSMQFGEDIRLVVNFEGTLSSCNDPLVPARRKISLNSPAELIGHLKDLPIALISVGNNHIGDYGNDVASFTLARLSMDHCVFGAGEAGKPFHLAKYRENDTIVSFANYCTSDTSPLFCNGSRIGPQPLQMAAVAKDLAVLKFESPHKVAIVHWGEEDFHHPRPAHVALGRRLIDSGFDLVIGHHPHSVQGFEHYKHGWIFYSLGNFSFADHTVTIEGSSCSVKWMPRRSWGLVPVFEVLKDSIQLREVKIVRSRRNGKPRLIDSRRLRRKLKGLCNDLATESYWRQYRNWCSREAFRIRLEEFLNNENKVRSIRRKIADSLGLEGSRS
jgi:hypothetical protein